MNIVLLSGGSGKRLWPLSNDIRSKQFIKIFELDSGSRESMVQRVYRQIKAADPKSTVTVATSKTQVSSLKSQLGEGVGISVEPCRRDTFPAISLVAAFLKDKMGVAENESVVVCPVDPYVNDDYFQKLKELSARADATDANLVLMGIEPTHPSEKYGYIIPNDKNATSTVKTFKEKPDEATAKEYISQGALWNAGVFSCKLGYLLEKAHEKIDFTDYADLFSKYDTLKKISFDYAIVEKEPKIDVLRFNGMWKDLGTWNTLTEAMKNNSIGNVVFAENCENVHAINELDVPVLCLGLKDVVVAASTDGILVSDKDGSARLKTYVENLGGQIMFAEKSWGQFQVIDVQDESMTIKVTLNAGQKMNYHSHEHRDEIWTIIEGEGEVVVDGMKQKVKAGDVVTIQADCRHTVTAKTKMKIIEVQVGKNISKSDKKKFPLD